jgi:polyphosphate:AMP phosphotransferase
MFESAELGHKIKKMDYEREVPSLREALLQLQYDLRESARYPVIILVAGMDGAGKSEMVNLLSEWMDPRFIRVHGIREPSPDERERPDMQRFWARLPPKGRIGVFFGSWYSGPIAERMKRVISRAELDQRLAEIVRFEKMLTDEGALVVKFWLHLSKKKQKKRLKDLEDNPLTRWRVTQRDWDFYDQYTRFYRTAENVLRETSTAEAPWLIVEGWDTHYRSLTVGRYLREALRRFQDESRPVQRVNLAPPLEPSIDNVHILKRLDLGLKCPKKDYREELEKQQGRLNLLTREPRYRDISVVAVFEGNDAAGKGGAIRRVTGALDARQYEIVPIAAPTEEERAQPYMWRFWRHIPGRGRLLIFDRSWYGRVLVERVEGFCSEYDWLRAYSEINDFEEQLVRNRTVVVKFWLSIGKDEQLRRFQERENTPFKQYKITAEDWRNREKWEDYERAVCDMVERTSTDLAPWTLVEANDKYYARIKILKTLCQSIEAAL